MSAERDIADALTKIAEVLERLSDLHFGLFTDDRVVVHDERTRFSPFPLTITGSLCPRGCGQLPHEGACRHGR